MQSLENIESSLRLPLLGTRESYELFQYILVSMTPEKAIFSIPAWLLTRTQLSHGEQISLNLHQNRIRYPVEVLENVGNAVVYRVHFPKNCGTFLAEGKGDVSTLAHLLKDSFFLKKGVLIYLKHLEPYFSRLFEFTETEYQDLKKLTFADVRRHVQEHIQQLEKLYQLFTEEVCEFQDVPLHVDLENLRESVLSELDLPFLETAFQESSPLQAHSYRLYLEAIKILEFRLYQNYNQIVFLYLRSL